MPIEASDALSGLAPTPPPPLLSLRSAFCGRSGGCSPECSGGAEERAGEEANTQRGEETSENSTNTENNDAAWQSRDRYVRAGTTANATSGTTERR